MVGGGVNPRKETMYKYKYKKCVYIIIIILYTLVANVLATEITFDDVKDKTRVRGRILSNVRTNNLLHCLRQCMVWQPHCRSININKNNEICELLESSLSQNKYLKVETAEGWIYYGETVIETEPILERFLGNTTMRLLAGKC